MSPDSKETKLGSSDQEPSPSAGKNTGVVLVLVPCCAWKYVPTAILWCGYFKGPWVSFVAIDEFSVRVKRIIGISKVDVELNVFKQTH